LEKRICWKDLVRSSREIEESCRLYCAVLYCATALQGLDWCVSECACVWVCACSSSSTTMIH
jgi:hypothetical protein